jgi:hypothetical protein
VDVLAESEGYLTARAFLLAGKKKYEVNAKIEIPKYIPQQLVGREIPFRMLAVPASKYDMVAVFDSPTYGLLKARKKTEVEAGKERKVAFIFKVPSGGKSGSGTGDVNIGDTNVNVNVSGKPDESRRPESMVCPICAKLRKGNYPLRKMAGTDSHHCDVCGNTFVFDSKGHLVPVHPGEEIPEMCPVCRSERLTERDFEIDGVKVHRIQCTNENCRGMTDGRGDRQPWYVDLNDADYNQWLELRKKRLLGRIDQLKVDPRIKDHLKDDARDHTSLGIKREIERMTKNVKAFGTTDIDYQRLGLIDKKLDRNREGDKDEYKNQYDAAKADLETNYGLTDDDPKKFSVHEAFSGASGDMDEKAAEKQSKDVYEKGRGRGLFGKYGAGKYLTRATHFGVKATETTVSSALLALIGIIIGTFFGWQFIVAFAAWAARNVIPDPKPLDMQRDFETRYGGSLFATQQNRYSSGLAITKSMLKLVILFFLGWGFLNTELPFRGFMLLVFFFAAYFSLPGEYSPSEPQKFMEGLLKPVVAIILAFVVFRGVFQSWELASLCLAFFFVFPLPTERNNLARAIGTGLSGASATYENIDKLLFFVLMLWGLITMGLIPGLGGGGLVIEWGTVFSNIFFPFWIVALIGGLVSPANVRPYTGVIMLIMVFIFFGLGEGEQIVGQGFFGVWWPTIHNAMTSFAEPIGEGFAAIGSTFGSTFTLLTNPVGYAHSVMEGTYEQNPTGITGAYGVEIESLMVPALYPGTDAVATFNVKNVGPMDAGDVRVFLGLPADLAPVLPMVPSYYSGLLAPSDPGFVEDFNIMEPSFVVPLYFNIHAENCSDINRIYGNWFTEWGDSNQKTSLRNHYIRVNATVEYDYYVESWMALDMISTQEWRDRTARGTFSQSKVISHISTSPAKLSIGSFDQPVVTGNRPFYIGLNLTSAEGLNSEILWNDPITNVSLVVPVEIEKNFKKNPGEVNPCSPPSDNRVVNKGTVTLTWYGNKLKNQAAFCFADSVDDLTVPSRTYYIRANSYFRFRKWETKDTLFAFDDVCGA